MWALTVSHIWGMSLFQIALHVRAVFAGSRWGNSRQDGIIGGGSSKGKPAVYSGTLNSGIIKLLCLSFCGH